MNAQAEAQQFARMRAGFIGVADVTYEFQGQLQRRLREIDRKALNAQVLVKRHGKELAAYGVVAQSFREGAQHLQHAAHEVQRAIQPLLLGFMQTLRDSQQVQKLGALSAELYRQAPGLNRALQGYRAQLQRRSTDSQRSVLLLRQALTRFQAVVMELEYVVINGRIEAALKGDARAALAQVSTDMDKAVVQVRELLRSYIERIEKVLT